MEKKWMIAGCLLVLGAVLLAGPKPKKPVPEPEAVEAAAVAEPTREQGPAETLNLLLIGQDRKPEEAGSRSDSMILCTFCPDRGQVVLTSILRDLYVEIPGYGKNRVNAAYAFGGPELLEKTLRKNLGAEMEGYVEIDFTHFAALMDLLGGVPMELRQDEAEEINRRLPGCDLHGGTVILDGQQALAYSRIRILDPDADVSRTARQRKVLEQVFGQYRKAKPETLVRLMRQALTMVTTDLSARDIAYWTVKLLPHMKDLEIRGERIPAEGTYRDLTVDHMAVLQADLEANRRLLGQIQCPGPEKS